MSLIFSTLVSCPELLFLKVLFLSINEANASYSFAVGLITMMCSKVFCTESEENSEVDVKHDI